MQNTPKSFKIIKDHITQQFIEKVGYYPNIDNPQSFNEKIQWLKLYYRDPLLTKCTDKLLVRDYIKEKIEKRFLVPLIGVYDDVDQIDFEKFPNKFVLKTNNASGRNIICKDKNKLNIKEARFLLNNWLKPENSHYFYSYEWAYKDIRPKIICEKYIEQENGELIDYKIYCFHGKPKFIRTFRNRYKQIKKNTYDLEWNPIAFSIDCENSPINTPKPKYLNEMIEVSKKLSKDFPLVRVDLYELKDSIYFGELTSYPASGLNPFIPSSADFEIGKLLNLNKIMENNTRQYLLNKKNRKAKIVIYTAIVGNYDQLIQHKYISNEFDYVCFTDQKIKNPGIWEIRKLKSVKTDKIRQARYHKVFPNKILSEYDYSIWIDANIDVLDNTLEKNINKLIKDKKIIGVVPHFERNCIYQEGKACIYLKKDNSKIVLKQMAFLKKDNYPKNNGLYETNFLFRKHGEKKIINLMDDWWRMIIGFSKRDQLSFNFVLWKNKEFPDKLLKINARLINSFDFKAHNDNEQEIISLIIDNHYLENQTTKTIFEINQLESDLNKIRSAKFFKLWQSYVKLKELI